MSRMPVLMQSNRFLYFLFTEPEKNPRLTDNGQYELLGVVYLTRQRSRRQANGVDLAGFACSQARFLAWLSCLSAAPRI